MHKASGFTMFLGCQTLSDFVIFRLIVSVIEQIFYYSHSIWHFKI